LNQHAQTIGGAPISETLPLSILKIAIASFSNGRFVGSGKPRYSPVLVPDITIRATTWSASALVGRTIVHAGRVSEGGAMSRITAGLVAAAAVLGITVGTPGFADAASIIVSPSSVAPGGDVRLSGDVLVDGTPGCEVPGTVTLISDAFAGLDEFAGVGAVNLPVDATGHFDSTVTLLASVAPGTYSIGGRCGGGNLGVNTTIVVGVIPPTGPGLAVQRLIAVGSTLVAIGVVMLATTRRRRIRGA
jgi:hypothetical protein